ncbi:MAG: sigma 54-interacting transcriptional regulator [Deltaproteobacteria bacterium]|nr:sigma 54-interacting transcriptional regulator [Deltaproteobacteria bacterium]
MRIGLELTVADRPMLWRSIEGRELLVGANPECDLSVPVDGVAPVQCLLWREGAALHLTNRSAAGTEVNGQRRSDSLQLAAGDCLRLGPVSARIVFQGEPASGNRTLTLEVGAAPAATLRLVAPASHPGRHWQISASGVTLGGDAKNDVVIADPFVSSFHARITLEHGRCMVRDLGSRNGVFIGEQKIREAEVRAGTAIRLGKTTIGIEVADAQALGPDPIAARLVGVSAAIARVRAVLPRLAQSDAPVLVLGETGTGKEVVTRVLHEQSPRAAGPFVAINCGSLSAGVVESELFGHEKGAFTGAAQKKVGAFEAAHRGTLFLDEVGELPLALQPQLLRVLETGEVRRVGSSAPFAVSVRVIAATNRDLAVEVGAGRFREDLFHRLHVLSLELPTLRERPDDVEVLARHFVTGFAPAAATLELTAAAVERLTAHAWPGNVRELRNVVQRAVLLRQGERIDADLITFTPSTLATRVQTQSATSQKTLAEIEREAIVAELRRHRGNRTEAAAALGVSRSTIHRRIEEFKIDTAALERG